MARSRVMVVGVDLEPEGDEAIRAALGRQAELPDAQLHFVCATDSRRLPDALDDIEAESDDELIERVQEAVRRRVEQVARAHGHPANRAGRLAHAALGKPVPSLLRMCVEHDAELLIVGTHARRGPERWVLGSVAEELLRQASCDVLVARSSARHTPRALTPEVEDIRER